MLPARPEVPPFGVRLALGGTALTLLWAVTLAPAAAEPGHIPVESAMLGVEDAFPVAPGQTELELTYSFSRATRAFGNGAGLVDRDSNRAHEGALTLTHGLTPDLDLAIGWFYGGYRDEDVTKGWEEGAGDLSLLAKWRFFGEGAEGWHVAYLPGLTIPVGEDDGALAPGLGFWSADQFLAITWLRGRFVVGGDAGYQLAFGQRRRARGFFLANFGAGYQLTPWLKPKLELNYGLDRLKRQQDPERLGVTLALVLNPRDRLRLDLGVHHHVYGRNSDRSFAAVANLSWTFGDER